MKPLANINIPRATLFYIFIVFLLASYSTIRVFNLSQAVQRVKTTADTTSYVRISMEPIFGTKFLANSRPFLFPLALKLFRNNAEKVVWAQGIFSIISWSILAVSVAYSLHVFFLRFLASGLILLLSLYRYVIAWDSVLLTESISLSLMVLFLAGWLWLMKGWRWHKLTLVSIVALLWAFSRDTNAWVVLMVALFLLLLVALRQIDKRYLVLSGAFIVMPTSSSLMELAGGDANSSDRAFYEDPALEDYRLWLYQNGKTCYVKWLLSDPMESMRRPLAEFNALISMQNIQSFLFSRRFSPVLPARLEGMLIPQRQLLILFAIVLGIILVAVLMKAWSRNKTWWVVIGLNALVFPHYFITWHGDVMGIYRHVVAVSIQFYLGSWLLILLVLDTVLSFQTVQEGSLNRFFMRSLKQSRN